MLPKFLVFVAIAIAISSSAVGQEFAPTPAKTKTGEARTEKIDAVTAAKILTATYERTKDANTSDDFGSVIEVCERALAADPPEKIRKYAQQLAAWAYNR